MLKKRAIDTLTKEEVIEFFNEVLPETPEILSMHAEKDWYVDVMTELNGMQTRVTFYQHYIIMGELVLDCVEKESFRNLKDMFYKAKGFIPEENPFTPYVGAV